MSTIDWSAFGSRIVFFKILFIVFNHNSSPSFVLDIGDSPLIAPIVSWVILKPGKKSKTLKMRFCRRLIHHLEAWAATLEMGLLKRLDLLPRHA